MAFDFTCLQTRKANSRSASSASVGARCVTTRRLASLDPAVVAGLRQEPAGQAAKRQRRMLPGRACRRSAAGADSLLARQHCLRRLIGVGRDDHLGKDRGDLLRRRQHPACGSPRRCRRTARPDRSRNALSQASASVAALATPHGLACLMIATVGCVEFRDALECRIGVVQVVVGQFLALHLHRGRDAAAARRST